MNNNDYVSNTGGSNPPHFHHFYFKTMINIFKCIIISIPILFLTGCVAISDKNEYERQVKGIGIDISFYPIVTMKIGYFDYVIKLKGNEK